MADESGYKKGLWTVEEDKLLTEYVQTNGKGKWNRIARTTGLKRCGKSCRLRWLNFLNPNVKHDTFAEDEDDLIIRLHKLLGNRWSIIAGRIPGRTDNNQVKNRWNTFLSKKVGIKKDRIKSVKISACKKLHHHDMITTKDEGAGDLHYVPLKDINHLDQPLILSHETAQPIEPIETNNNIDIDTYEELENGLLFLEAEVLGLNDTNNYSESSQWFLNDDEFDFIKTSSFMGLLDVVDQYPDDHLNMMSINGRDNPDEIVGQYGNQSVAPADMNIQLQVNTSSTENLFTEK